MIHKSELEAANAIRARLEQDMAKYLASGGNVSKHDITERAEDRPKLKYGKQPAGVDGE